MESARGISSFAWVEASKGLPEVATDLCGSDHAPGRKQFRESRQVFPARRKNCYPIRKRFQCSRKGTGTRKDVHKDPAVTG